VAKTVHETDVLLDITLFRELVEVPLKLTVQLPVALEVR